MSKFFKGAWLFGSLIIAILFLFSCFSQFIPARIFSYTVFFALLFPYLFIAVLVIAIITLFISKRWSLLFFLLLIPGLYSFFLVIAISPFSKWKMQKDINASRIMTWNVSDFINPALATLPDAKPRLAILKTISQYNPDIICIQEYSNESDSKKVASVKQELDSIGYKYIAYSGDQTAKSYFGHAQKGVVICSKTPFLDTGRIQIRKDFHPEFLQFADLMIHGKPVRIATAHLASYFLFPDSAHGYDGKKRVAKKLLLYKRNVQEKLRDVEAFHDQQAALIRSFLDTSSLPVIYCGDCNAVSTMYSYRLLKGNKQDAFLKGGNGIGTTFYKMIPTLRIDMCFPDKHFKVEQSAVIPRKLGDHDPVVTDVKWKEQ